MKIVFEQICDNDARTIKLVSDIVACFLKADFEEISVSWTDTLTIEAKD